MTDLHTLAPTRINLVDDVAWQDDLAPLVPTDVLVIEIDLDAGPGQDGSYRRTGTADRSALFAATGTAVGLDPPESIRTWSGMQDRLWERLAEQDAAAGLLVLRRADALLDGALADLLQATAIFEELSRSVGGDAAGSGAGSDTPMDLRVVLTGVGPDFPVALP